MEKRFISTKRLIEHFNLEVINEKDLKEYRNIYGFSISRAGIELSTQTVSTYLSKFMIAWGKTESLFLNQLPIEEAKKSVQAIFKALPPLLLLTKSFDSKLLNLLVTEAKPYGVAIVYSKDKSYSALTLHMASYLIEHFAPTTQLHASLVNINGIGVLIVGESGIGKSEAALELLQRNYIFIADDAVRIRRLGEHFFGSSADITKDILEIRGIGLINVKSVYGLRSIRPETKIDLVVELLERNSVLEEERLGESNLFFEILNAKLKKIQIRVKEGRSLGVLIEAAVNSWIASQNEETQPIDLIQKRGWGIDAKR